MGHGRQEQCHAALLADAVIRDAVFHRVVQRHGAPRQILGNAEFANSICSSGARPRRS
jgi:hypothetical protein